MKMRHFMGQSLLLATTAVGAVILGTAPQLALANNECGFFLANDGLTDTIACGSGPFAAGITYQVADINDPALFILTNTQVPAGGVLLQSAGNDESITLNINQVLPGAAPSITNNAGTDAGVRITTTGTNAFVTVNVNAGTISGGGGTRPGFTVVTSGAGAPINFTSAAGTTISSSAFATSGVSLSNTGGAAVAGTINGTVTATGTTTGTAAGSGTATGLLGTASNGNGNATLTVGSTGIINGSGTGVAASTANAGDVSVTVNGQVNQTSASASPLSTLSIPVGVSGNNLASGDVNITTNAGSSVTQVGHVASFIPAIGNTEGIGISGLTNSGATLITANGNVSATGIGVSSVSNSGTATATVGGNVTMTAGTGSGSSFFLGAGIIPPGVLPFVGDTVGAYAQSTTNTATTNLFGGNIGQGTDTTFADIGLASVVLSPTATTASTINVGNGTAQASNVFANNIGLFGLNVGTGATNVNSHVLDPEGDQNVVNAGGFGLLGIGLGSGAVNVNGGVVNVSGANPLTIPGVPFAISGGLVGISLGSGNVAVTAHGDINASGATFGALALATTGSATVNANDGIAIDPLIGEAAVVLAGNLDATVNNNADTVDADLIGLISLNLGAGNAIVNSNNSVVTAPVSAAAVAIGANADAIGNNTNSGVWNGAVVLAGGRDALLNNTVNSEININGISAIAMFAGRDAIITNDTGSDINLVGINLNLMVAGRDAIINNDRGSNINLVGINANVMVADRDAIINNDDGATINLVGINGNLMVAGDDTTINNQNGAAINLIGLNTLGFVAIGGTSTINNSSAINVSGFATMLGLNTFNNAGGILDMRNGTSDYDSPVLDLLAAPYGNGVGDVTVMTNVPIINENTQFNGGGQLGIDAFLRGSGADSSSDLLLIGGSVNGTTNVVVNDTNPGAGTFNPTGILFAHADGSNPGTFQLQNGPIDKGFFDYDIFKRQSLLDPDLAEANDWVLASYPNGRGFELPKLITGAQTIWYESSGVWLDRTADLRRQLECAPALAPAPQVEPLKVAPSDDVYAGGAPCVQQRYGVWVRGFGGDFNRDKTDKTTLFGVTKTSNGDYDQDLWGIEGGADIVIARPNSGYGALFAGVLGGFVQSDMEFNATRDKAEYDGGMVGGYLTYLAGGWYNDLLFKADLLSVDYKTSFLGAKASPDVDSFGIRYDTGYRFNMGRGFFVDPQGTIAWVETDMDNVTLLNTVVNFSDGESVRGRLGGRIGYSTMWGATVVEPFFVGSFWHEFEGDNKATLTSGAKIALKDELDDSWGELGGGVNFFTGPRTSLFVKGDALVGGDLEGWNVKGGGRLAW